MTDPAGSARAAALNALRKRTSTRAGMSRYTAVGQTQTDKSEFLELRQLQLASTQQQHALHQLRGELQDALAMNASQVSSVASYTASERDEHYRELTRHLERTHKQALENERAASAANLKNELIKQREMLQRTILEQFQDERRKRELQLEAAQDEAEELRGKLARAEQDMGVLQTDLAQQRDLLANEREQMREMKARAVREAREREEERIAREKQGFYVEATLLHAAEAQVIEVTSRLEQSVEAHKGAKADLEMEAQMRAAAEDRLAVAQEALENANARIQTQIDEASDAAAAHQAAMRAKAEEARKALAAEKAAAERAAELSNVMTSRQANALQKLATENASLLSMLSGLPSLKNGVANAPPLQSRPASQVAPEPPPTDEAMDMTDGVSGLRKQFVQGGRGTGAKRGAGGRGPAGRLSSGGGAGGGSSGGSAGGSGAPPYTPVSSFATLAPPTSPTGPAEAALGAAEAEAEAARAELREEQKHRRAAEEAVAAARAATTAAEAAKAAALKELEAMNEKYRKTKTAEAAAMSATARRLAMEAEEREAARVEQFMKDAEERKKVAQAAEAARLRKEAKKTNSKQQTTLNGGMPSEGPRAAGVPAGMSMPVAELAARVEAQVAGMQEVVADDAALSASLPAAPALAPQPETAIYKGIYTDGINCREPFGIRQPLTARDPVPAGREPPPKAPLSSRTASSTTFGHASMPMPGNPRKLPPNPPNYPPAGVNVPGARQRQVVERASDQHFDLQPLHTGVDALGMSTAWRTSQPSPRERRGR